MEGRSIKQKRAVPPGETVRQATYLLYFCRFMFCTANPLSAVLSFRPVQKAFDISRVSSTMAKSFGQAKSPSVTLLRLKMTSILRTRSSDSREAEEQFNLVCAV